jgi:hypothetical protein
MRRRRPKRTRTHRVEQVGGVVRVIGHRVRPWRLIAPAESALIKADRVATISERVVEPARRGAEICTGPADEQEWMGPTHVARSRDGLRRVRPMPSPTYRMGSTSLYVLQMGLLARTPGGRSLGTTLDRPHQSSRRRLRPDRPLGRLLRLANRPHGLPRGCSQNSHLLGPRHKMRLWNFVGDDSVGVQKSNDPLARGS